MPRRGPHSRTTHPPAGALAPRRRATACPTGHCDGKYSGASDVETQDMAWKATVHFSPIHERRAGEVGGEAAHIKAGRTAAGPAVAVGTVTRWCCGTGSHRCPRRLACRPPPSGFAVPAAFGREIVGSSEADESSSNCKTVLLSGAQ